MRPALQLGSCDLGHLAGYRLWIGCWQGVCLWHRQALLAALLVVLGRLSSAAGLPVVKGEGCRAPEGYGLHRVCAVVAGQRLCVWLLFMKLLVCRNGG